VAESLTIVMPAYNESAVIDKVVHELVADVLSRLPEATLLILDDCSTDETPRILEELQASHSGVRAERNPENMGHGPTVVRGIGMAETDWVLQMDSDRQTVAEDFWLLWERRDEADLVMGVRVHRDDPRHRLILTRLVRFAVRLLARQPIADANIPFKLFRRELWDDLAPSIRLEALFPSIEIALGAAVRDWRVLQIPIRWRRREEGFSTIRRWKLVKICARGTEELAAYRWSLLRRPPREPSEAGAGASSPVAQGL
jgi:dolichol-phosphate mannosyltransferase